MINRRQFLQQAGGLTFCLAFVPPLGFGKTAAGAVAAAPGVKSKAFNAYVNIATNGTVTIINPAAEMGQGVMTALPVIVAEELDVDWDDVRIESSPPFGEVYGDPLFFNRIFTTSSRTITNYYERLRRFGREARQALLENARTELACASDGTADRAQPCVAREIRAQHQLRRNCRVWRRAQPEAPRRERPPAR